MQNLTKLHSDKIYYADLADLFITADTVELIISFSIEVTVKKHTTQIQNPKPKTF